MTLLPAGFVSRACRRSDLDAVIAMMHTVEIADMGEVMTPRDELDSTWRESRVDLAEDTCVVHDQTGRLVGYALAWEGVAGKEIEVDTYACATTRNTTLDRYLLDWAVARGSNIAARAGTPLTAFAAALQGEVREPLLVQLAFAATRWFHRMVIDLEAVSAPRSVPGIEVAPLATTSSSPYVVPLEAVHATTIEAFRDHWGADETTFAEWHQRWVDRDAFDPTLWFVALDGDEVAGALVALVEPEVGAGRIPLLGVRRPWRGRGIAEALLYASFAAFVERGVRRVSLGVDTQSLTGATRLYERVGMTRAFTIVVYCRTIEPASP